ncbi:MAG: sel1 repeat family protein [Solobacterium sp.]|nr:sel1 repeat family protein [Solobacterium sp.]
MSSIKDQLLICTAEEARDFVQYRIPWHEFSHGEADAALSVDGAYVVELEDILAALRRFRRKKAVYREMEEEWIRPIIRNADEIGMNIAVGSPDRAFRDIDVTEMSKHEPLSREEAVAWIFMQLVTVWAEADEIPYDALIAPAANILWNETHPASSPRYTDGQKDHFITDIFDQDRTDSLSEEDLKRFRRYTEQLIKKGSLNALRIRAYSCYGGNAAYACDWDYAREALEVILQATQDPFAANTLGYLYYYGRGSLPGRDYPKAYQYFTIGAFNGVYESMYKSADILIKGEGVPQNYRAAAKLISRVYYENLERLGNGVYDSKFADAALRMGNLYRDGTGLDQDDMEAYECYLQADLAIRQRLPFKHYGDNAVYQRIEHALEDMKEKLAGGIELHSLNDATAEYLRDLMDGYPGRLRVSSVGNTARLEVSRVSYTGMPVPRMLVTVGPMSYCKLCDVFVMYAQNVRERKLPEEPVDFDYMDYSPETGALDFYHWGERVAGVTGDFLIQDDRYIAGMRAEDEQEHTFVSAVRIASREKGSWFRFGERFEAICPFDVDPGDLVLISTGTELAAAEVTAVYRAKMSDLPYSTYTIKRVEQRITADDVPLDYRFIFEEQN